MIKKNKIGILASMLLTFQAFAQTYFNNLYDHAFLFNQITNTQAGLICAGDV